MAGLHPAPDPASPVPALGLDVTIPVASSGSESAPVRVHSSPDRSTLGRLDHFLLDRRLGSGGMGAVYLGHDESLDRPVAIKILPDELASKAEAQERFIREAQAQARLSSPHVVQIYFIGRAPPEARITLSGRVSSPDAATAPLPGSSVPPPGGGSLYFAMELVDGGSLEALLERGERLDPERARRFMIQVARGLRDAFRAGLVHRDIKPGNLLVDRDGDLKIADFGLAKPSDPNLNLTQERAVLGTPLYMAPEQGLGEALDHRADMYALGCSFFHLLTGAPPFLATSAVAMIAQHMSAPPPPLRERAPAVPLRLAAIIERLMAKDRAARYPTYDDLIAALEAAAPERIELAGFWTRGAAAAVDALLAGALIGLVGWAGLVVYIAYLTVAHALFGQTLAKYALRIQVQRLDGSRLGFPRALGRTLAALWLPFLMGLLILRTGGRSALQETITEMARLDGVRSLIIAIIGTYAVLALFYASGFLLAAVSRQKRAVHDFLAGSHVVYRLGPRTLARPGPG